MKHSQSLNYNLSNMECISGFQYFDLTFTCFNILLGTAMAISFFSIRYMGMLILPLTYAATITTTDVKCILKGMNHSLDSFQPGCLVVLPKSCKLDPLSLKFFPKTFLPSYQYNVLKMDMLKGKVHPLS